MASQVAKERKKEVRIYLLGIEKHISVVFPLYRVVAERIGYEYCSPVNRVFSIPITRAIVERARKEARSLPLKRNLNVICTSEAKQEKSWENIDVTRLDESISSGCETSLYAFPSTRQPPRRTPTRIVKLARRNKVGRARCANFNAYAEMCTARIWRAQTLMTDIQMARAWTHGRKVRVA